jgi:hypothetical protein
MNHIIRPLEEYSLCHQMNQRKFRNRGKPRYEFFQLMTQEKRSIFLKATVGRYKKWLDYLSALGQLKQLKQYN